MSVKVSEEGEQVVEIAFSCNKGLSARKLLETEETPFCQIFQIDISAPET